MGYYSEVVIQCEEKAFCMIKKSIENYNKKYRTDGYVDFKPSSIQMNTKKEFVLNWSGIKWYSDFTDVQVVEEVLKKLDKIKELAGYRYNFLRVGECAGDIENRSNDVCYGSCFAETHIYVDESFSELEEVEL